ncbi:hypothetical protein CONPUDRAFT_146963 [Coniophora puteana RWD-64-598 SS2]|uniref:Uncharacterized protein n=1 Tax=Coniophora puteana (strain RWD-64-598) TaxID=741705 RepID=A0A5M3M9L5_CONPW|nr:uncharacterized protein CONPUDRAFT_146963 [Coniophora puteana RWD-64-598 SS2]EIW75869.1 hypothetical protein CONPUDRAFT_146963 [Coniophora puteana RWD-64-598 SS2]
MIMRRWAEEMVVRSGSDRIRFSQKAEERDVPRLKRILGRMKELVVEAPLDPLISLFDELNAMLEPSREDVMLENLSLKRATDGRGWSDRDPTAKFSFVDAGTVKKLHLGRLLFSLRPINFFSGMVNLRELTLLDSVGSTVSDFTGSQVYLPSLARLHLSDPIEFCRTFLTSLHHPNPLQYLGIDDANERFQPPQFLHLILRMLSDHHILGGSATDTPPNLSECNCALSITTRVSLRGRHAHLGFAAWPNTIISGPDLISSISEGLSWGSRPYAALTPVEFSTLLTSNPTLFIGGAFRSYFHHVSEALPKSIPLHTVACAVINDPTDVDNDIAQDGLYEGALLSEMPSLLYLRLNHARLVSVINRLRPADNSNSGILVPILGELALVFTPDVQHEKWVSPLAACIIARSAHGHGLKKLHIRGNPHITEDERKMLEDLPVIINWRSVSEL